MNSRRASGWVLDHHANDESPHFLRNPSSANHPAGFGDHTPIKRNSGSVPAHNGLWAHNNESLFPSGPESSRQYPEEFIEGSQLWPRIPPLEDCQLLAKSQIFMKKDSTSAEHSKRCTHQNSDGIYHAKVVSHFACGWQRSVLLKFLAN